MSEVVEITVNNNGSIRISGGEFVIKDGSGNSYDLGGRKAIGLCRCGKSNNKPFCDGAHKQCEFDSVVVATTLPPPKTA